jgi:hypothetical protein
MRGAPPPSTRAMDYEEGLATEGKERTRSGSLLYYWRRVVGEVVGTTPYADPAIFAASPLGLRCDRVVIHDPGRATCYSGSNRPVGVLLAPRALRPPRAAQAALAGAIGDCEIVGNLTDERCVLAGWPSMASLPADSRRACRLVTRPIASTALNCDSASRARHVS